jgi:nucleoid-associated protein YgaU
MNGSGQNQSANGAVPADATGGAPDAAMAEATPSDATGAAPAAAPTEAPAVAPAVAGMPEQGSKMAYVVEAGDTLAKIAMKIYGDQKRWKDIANLSGMDNPNHIYPGDMVYYSLDDSSKNFASAYESIKRAKEVVREGDTLAAISQRVYGTSKAWRHIWRQNDNIDNPDVLSAGMTIYYVEKGAVKTALNKLKGQVFAKVLKDSKTSASKVVKSAKVMSKVSATVPTTSV